MRTISLPSLRVVLGALLSALLLGTVLAVAPAGAAITTGIDRHRDDQCAVGQRVDVDNRRQAFWRRRRRSPARPGHLREGQRATITERPAGPSEPAERGIQRPRARRSTGASRRRPTPAPASPATRSPSARRSRPPARSPATRASTPIDPIVNISENSDDSSTRASSLCRSTPIRTRWSSPSTASRRPPPRSRHAGEHDRALPVHEPPGRADQGGRQARPSPAPRQRATRPPPPPRARSWVAHLVALRPAVNQPPTVSPIVGAANVNEGVHRHLLGHRQRPRGQRASRTRGRSQSGPATIVAPTNASSVNVNFGDGPGSGPSAGRRLRRLAHHHPRPHDHRRQRRTDGHPASCRRRPSTKEAASRSPSPGRQDPSGCRRHRRVHLQPSTAAPAPASVPFGAASSVSCPTSDEGTRHRRAPGSGTRTTAACAEYTATVQIANVAPSATFTASSPVDEGTAIALALSTPTDPSPVDTAAGFTYAFDCGSGLFGEFGTATTASLPHRRQRLPVSSAAQHPRRRRWHPHLRADRHRQQRQPDRDVRRADRGLRGRPHSRLSLTAVIDLGTADTHQFAFDCGAGFGSLGARRAASCTVDDGPADSDRAGHGAGRRPRGRAPTTGWSRCCNVAPTADLKVPPTVEEGSAIEVALDDPPGRARCHADTIAGFTYAFDCDGPGLDDSFGEPSAISSDAVRHHRRRGPHRRRPHLRQGRRLHRVHGDCRRAQRRAERHLRRPRSPSTRGRPSPSASTTCTTRHRSTELPSPIPSTAATVAPHDRARRPGCAGR